MANVFLYQAIAFLLSGLIISSMYWTFFLVSSPQTIIDTEGEEKPKNLFATCGVANFYLDDINEIGVGVATNYMEFPWHVFIQKKMVSGDIYRCGGSLIADRWILTAAHCLETIVEGNRLKELRVTLGMHNYKTLSQGFEQTFYLGKNSFFFHPEFDPVTWDQDIALIKLPSTATFSEFLRPVCLPNWNEPNYVGEQATIAGWSSTYDDNRLAYPEAAVLYKMNVTVISNSKCKATYGDIADDMFCTNGNNRFGVNGACIISNRDAGSPLIFKRSNGRWRQIGILSHDKNCKKKLPLLYTKVSSFAPWIQQTMKQSSSSRAFSFLSSSLVTISIIITYLKKY